MTEAAQQIEAPAVEQDAPPPSGEPRAYPWWTRGDTDAFFALFADNIATILALTILCGTSAGGVWSSEIILQRMLPGIGWSVLFGNMFYAWQATRMHHKQETGDGGILGCFSSHVNHNPGGDGKTWWCAQPYGINTPGAFIFYYSIIIAIKVKKGYFVPGVTYNPNDEGLHVYHVCVWANLIGGLVELAGAVFGPLIVKYVPKPVLFTPLAAIGITFLTLNNLFDIYVDPRVGLPPLFLMMTMMWGGVRIGRVPAMVIVVLFATALDWIWNGKHVKQWAVEKAANDFAELRYDRFQAFPLAQSTTKQWEDVGDYMSWIVPCALMNFIETIQCLESAKSAGDEYNLPESMLADGIGTIIGAMLGSPFGTTVYIGHPVYKKMNATRGYSLLNGFVVWVLCWFGFLGIVGEILSLAGLRCVLVFVGVVIASFTIQETPVYQYPTILLGICPVLATWATQKCPAVPPTVTRAKATLGWYYLGQGAEVLNCFVIAGLAWDVIDRRFDRAMVWCLVGAVCSLFGIIHGPKIEGDFKGTDPDGDDEGYGDSEWVICAGYGFTLVMCLMLFIMQHCETKNGTDAEDRWVPPPRVWNQVGSLHTCMQGDADPGSPRHKSWMPEGRSAAEIPAAGTAPDDQHHEDAKHTAN